MVSTASRNLLDAVNTVHDLYYQGGTWCTTFLGVAVLKNPMDLWAYQVLISERRPAIIIETGTYFGGSALYLATLCETLGHGRVLSVDLVPHTYRPPHPRLTYLVGDSAAPETLARVADWAGDDRGMVILDSDHSAAHVSRELDGYAPFVGAGDHLVVEDTNVNGHPTWPSFGPGPAEAVEAWLPGHPAFQVERWREPFLTFNPGGYLKRIAD